MWIYEKKLEFPVNIKNPNPALAKIIISQLGGPDGELGASMRYLNQRYAMPDRRIMGMFTDIGTEELAHLEIVGAILHQLTKNLSMDEIKKSGFDTYFVDHTAGVYTAAASGTPFNAFCFQSKGDVLTDIHEDLAAEQKARTTYDNILRLCDDYDVREPIKFLREREVVHYQRFAEALAMAQDSFEDKHNFYAYNPAFDKKPCPKSELPSVSAGIDTANIGFANNSCGKQSGCGGANNTPKASCYDNGALGRCQQERKSCSCRKRY